MKEKRSKRQTSVPPAFHCSSLACSASSSLCAPQFLCFSYSISLLYCKSSTAPSSMAEMQRSSALREYGMSTASQTLVTSSTMQRKQLLCKPLPFQLSRLPLWEDIWNGYVHISSDLLATVPFLHFGQGATSWGPILCKQKIETQKNKLMC